jgi:hypothetical protein
MSTIQDVMTESWQKGTQSVTKGSHAVYTCIQEAFANNRGALIGRHGTIELTVVLLKYNRMLIDASKLQILENNAGVFPLQYNSILEWVVDYTEATKQADCMAVGWHIPLARPEWSYLHDISPHSKRIPLRSLEPYYVEDSTQRWTRALEGQKVCVVSSFVDSMESQLENLNNVWPDQQIFPSTIQWSFVRTGYAPVLAKGRAEWEEGIQSWKDAVDWMEREVCKHSPRVVLIGCGGLAMPLAKRLKEKGMIAIVMGGAIQVLFGIKGRRWASHPIISKFWNSHWIQPFPYEVPKGAVSVEGGCYW